MHSFIHTYTHTHNWLYMEGNGTRRVSHLCDIGGWGQACFPRDSSGFGKVLGRLVVVGVCVQLSKFKHLCMAVRGSAVELEPISDGRSTGPRMQIMQRPNIARHEWGCSLDVLC